MRILKRLLQVDNPLILSFDKHIALCLNMLNLVLLFHLILASTSAVLGTFAYSQRNRSSYLALVLLSGIIILIAGHLGGLMVHGS